MLNRADSAYGIRVADVENSIGRKIDHSDRLRRSHGRLRPQPGRAVRAGATSRRRSARTSSTSPGPSPVTPQPSATPRMRRPRPTRSCSRGADDDRPTSQPTKGDDADVAAEAHRERAPGRRRQRLACRRQATRRVATPGAGRRPPTARAAGAAAAHAVAGPAARVVPRHQVPIQQRVIADLDPKLDLANQIEVRRADRGDLRPRRRRGGPRPHPRRARRMLEQITDEIVGLGPLEPLLRDETHHRGHGQRPAPGLRRAQRQARADRRHVPERRPRDAHHRPHHRAPRPARRRVAARWSTPACPTAPASTPSSRRSRLVGPGAHHPQVRRVAAHGRRPDPLRHRRRPRCSTSSRPASKPG